MFVRLSVCLSGTGVYCDHTMHDSADLSLWLDSPMFWAPFSLEESWGMDVQTKRRDISRTVDARG